MVKKEHKRKAPKGHFVVYVGEGQELKRFLVPLSYLKTPPFQKLLDKAAEEFGFVSQNAIVIPCEESTFRKILEFAAASTS